MGFYAHENHWLVFGRLALTFLDRYFYELIFTIGISGY